MPKPWPIRATPNRATLIENCGQARITRVTLRNGVRRNQPERAAVSQKTESAAIEMRHQVGIAVCPLVERLKPGQIIAAIPGDDRVLARKRRIADDGVEARILAREHLGKFDRPVKGAKRMLTR